MRRRHGEEQGLQENVRADEQEMAEAAKRQIQSENRILPDAMKASDSEEFAAQEARQMEGHPLQLHDKMIAADNELSLKRKRDDEEEQSGQIEPQPPTKKQKKAANPRHQIANLGAIQAKKALSTGAIKALNQTRAYLKQAEGQQVEGQLKDQKKTEERSSVVRRNAKVYRQGLNEIRSAPWEK